jgi:hypothetical protein
LISGFYDESLNPANRLHKGIRDTSKSKKVKKNKEKPIKTQLEQKKEIMKLKKEIQEKKMI